MLREADLAVSLPARKLQMAEEYLSEIDQIELLPGFTVLEHTPGYTRLIIPSEYTIRVKRLPPFLFDLKGDSELKDPGPLKIMVKVMEKLEPPGYEQEILYEPPTNDDGQIYCPDREEHERGWLYYQQWRKHEAHRNDLVQLRSDRQWDLAIANCIFVEDGPDKMDADNWLEPMLDYITEPETLSARKAIFMRSQVIGDRATRDVIQFLFTVEEVTLEGLKIAFDSFRRLILGRAGLGAVGQVARRLSKVQS